MSKIIGFGGLFIRSKQQNELINWYKNILEIEIESWGGLSFNTNQLPTDSYQVFNIFSPETNYFPIKQTYLLNFLVDDLSTYIEMLKSKDITILGFDENEYGKFAWVNDIDGNKIELWQKP